MLGLRSRNQNSCIDIELPAVEFPATQNVGNRLACEPAPESEVESTPVVIVQGVVMSCQHLGFRPAEGVRE